MNPAQLNCIYFKKDSPNKSLEPYGFTADY